MSNWQKLKTAIESGNVTERLIQAFLTRQKRLEIGSFRLRNKSIRRNCSENALAWYSGKAETNKILRRCFADTSAYNDVIDAPDREAILGRANSYLAREFDILGSGTLILKKIDWHTDYKSGFRWEPGTFYKDYIQVSLSNSADVKWPRELSRCHHFLILGQAFLISDNEQYAEEFLTQISDWIDSNPLMKSINWGCTMDVAIRAVNWIWALSMFVESDLMTDSALRKIIVSLYEHGYFIYRNPEKGPVNNHNHYISDLVGQIYLGVMFDGAEESTKWLKQGTDELFREIRSQILPTGPTYERSTNYHRLVLELLSSAIILLKRNDTEIPADIWCRLESMYQFVQYYIKPDGLAPVIGDQDDGRAHPFGIQRNIDHRYLLSIGSILFKRVDFKFNSSGYNPDCFFLLGPDSKHEFNSIDDVASELQSISFPDAGFYVLRDRDNYMFVNVSGKSRYSEIGGGTHTHSDLLSFELAVNGKTFLLDPGTYLYSASPRDRMLFRSTRMHNTVTIDGENQNVLKEDVLWDFERNAIPEVTKWISTEEADFFEGSHSGYQRLARPATHRRKITFDKKSVQWIIEDVVTGEGKYIVEAFFHFDKDIDFEIDGYRAITRCADERNIELVFSCKAGLELIKGSSWISKRYGERVKSKVLTVKAGADCPIVIRTTINTIDN